MPVQKKILDFYSGRGAMRSTGKYTTLLERLPNNVATLVRTVQGLTFHEYVASSLFLLWRRASGRAQERISYSRG